MCRLTIIIPAYGRQQDLDDTLLSVLENRPTHCEVLVPHTESYHDPYDLSDEVRFLSVPSVGLVELVNAAIDASQAALVHILQSGTQVTPGWTDAVVDQFAADFALAAVAPRMMNRSGQTPQELRGIRYLPGGAKRYVPAGAPREAKSAAAGGLEGPSLQAGFYRRCALLSIGHFDADLGEYYCDVDALVKLRRSGWRCEYQPDSRVVGPLLEEPQGFQAGRQMERLFCRHAAVGPVRTVLSHPWIVGQALARQFPRARTLTSLAGHLYGLLLECLACRRHRWHPQSLEPACAGPSDRQPPATIALQTARRGRYAGPVDKPVPLATRRLG